MPRRRIRRTDGSSRQQKMWAAQRKPGMGGVMPFGPSSRGGGATVVGRPGGGGQGQVRIEHVTLHAVEGQTIAAGGGPVQWFRRGGPPTEQRGFDSLATALDGGAVGDIPIDVAGELEAKLGGLWETYRSGGDIELVRIRSGVEVPHVFDGGPLTSRLFRDSQQGIPVLPNDLVRIRMPNATDQILTWAALQLRIIATSDPASAALGVVSLSFGPMSMVWVTDGWWVTSRDDNLVRKVNMAGTVIDSFDATGLDGISDMNLYGITSDGTDLWIVNSAQSGTTDNRLLQVDTAGTLVSSFNPSSFTEEPRGLAHDGTHLWLGDGTNGKVRQVSTAGVVQATIDHPVVADGSTETYPGDGVAWTGTGLWLTATAPRRAYLVNTSGDVIESFDVEVGTANEMGAAMRQGRLWIADRSGNRLVQLR